MVGEPQAHGTQAVSDLIAGVANSDRSAFRTLYSEASPRIFGVCLRILKDSSQAEDAMQEVFARVWHGARHFDARHEDGTTWLITIARNHAIDRLRAQPAKTAPVHEAPEFAEPVAGPDDGATASDEAEHLSACFDLLDPARATALRSAYLNALSYEELSQHHDVPLDTMRSWLRRGLVKVKECLEA